MSAEFQTDYDRDISLDWEILDNKESKEGPSEWIIVDKNLKNRTSAITQNTAMSNANISKYKMTKCQDVNLFQRDPD